jgi:hypothetical protein
MTSIPEDHMTKDSQGNVRQTDHTKESIPTSDTQASGTVNKIAGDYLKEVLGIRSVRSTTTGKETDDELALTDTKEVRDLTVLQYAQMYQGLPVWHRGAAVIIQTETKEVLESTNTIDHEVKDVKPDTALLRRAAKNLTHQALSEMMLMEKNSKRIEKISGGKIDAGKAKLSVKSSQPVIYKYLAAERQREEKEDNHEDRSLVLRALKLVLPAVDSSIKDGGYYAVNEVFIDLKYDKNEMHIHALIEPRTNSILYIRPLVELASAWVYDNDPLNVTGDILITPGSPVSVLNGPRTPRPLPGGLGGSPVSLSGQYVVLQDICPLPIAPPTDLNGRFDYNADTADFSAANAYYHNDFAFRMVEEMGFTISSYFDGTTFPLPVDHMGCFTCVNAAVWGLGTGQGTAYITYGFAQASQPVGIAAAVGVVLHEFGHVILLDNAWSGNFGFAHSCGDSLAALICDPHSKAPDRFMTFPWISVSTPVIDRRHDRPIAGGWAWGGVNDDGGYGSEQILSTSHFRAYLSMGGGSADVCDREWASRYLTFLIIYGVGTLTQPTNPADPEPWADRLQFLDRATPVFEGHPGGAVHKVIHWAFEQQGAYQPAGAILPITTVGAPPDFDIYINDGRNGEYGYTDDFCHSLEIWNRNCPDGGPAHQQPIPGIDNYAYVIVRNRGTQPIPVGWTIRGYHLRENSCCGCCDDCKNLQWPKDFIAMKKPLYVSTQPIAPGDYQIIAPLTWRPGENDCMLMVADAKRDPSNVNFIRPGESLPAKRLVPLDNNIAMRCLCKQCNPDYSKLKGLCKRVSDKP